MFEQTLHELFHKTSVNDEILHNHNELTQAFPDLYQAWQKRFPFDVEAQIGLELTVSFQKSKEYKEGDDLLEKFLQFCRKFWHLVTERPEHLLKETINEVFDFHIHYYEMSKDRLRGPHPLDMKTEVINLLDLNEKMSELIIKSTSQKSILIHTSTGDDLYDHTYGARWLGDTLPLDFSQLD